MLQGVFSHDNSVWRFIGKLGGLIVLNILWIVCSIPVFTVGASTTAVYYVILEPVRDEDDSTIRSSFRSFKSNFKQATAIWLILLAAGIVLGFDLQFFVLGQMSLNGAIKTAMTTVSDGLLLIYLSIITYVLSLQARSYNPVKRTLFNVFFVPMCHLFQTTGILVTDLGIAAATYFGPFYFPQFAMLLSLFETPLIALVNPYFFTATFRKYTPEEEEQGHIDVTPLLGEEDEEMKETVRNLKGK